MRIKNKYIRNRHFREKSWKRVRNTEHPYQTCMPFLMGGSYKPGYWSFENQVKWHFNWIDKRARALEKGSRRGMWLSNVPSGYRRGLNRIRKAKERDVMAKIRQGDYEAEFPRFYHDAHWLYW